MVVQVKAVVIAIERGPTERQLRELALGHAAEAIDDATYLSRAADLRPARRPCRGGLGSFRERVVAWLRSIGNAIQHADLPAERADLIHAVYERIVVAGPTFVSARLTALAYQHSLALAFPQVVMARPIGFERAIPATAADDRRSSCQAAISRPLVRASFSARISNDCCTTHTHAR